MPAGHHARVAAMGGNTALAKRYVNSVAAGACVGSLGESIVLNGAPGGYIQKAAKDRRMHGAAGLLPSSSPARATLPAPRAGGADSDGGEDDGDDSDPDAIGRNVPPADMDVSWIDGVPINQIRGIRAKMQELPSRPVLRNHLLQPCVFAFNMVGANATDNSTAKAAIGYKMYAMCHIVIFGRPRGATRISKPELRRRAATIAAGGLQRMWDEMVAACGVGHVSAADVKGVQHGADLDAGAVDDPPLRPSRALSD